jgi:hypothetical protein
MNEFLTDLEKPYTPREGWVSSSLCPVETSMYEAMNGISSSLEQNLDVYSADGRRLGNGLSAGNEALHRNSYPKVLAGISAGALLGFIIASGLNGRTG